MTCSHQWIDPEAPPIERQVVAPYLMEGNPKAMQIGKRYRCQRCGEETGGAAAMSAMKCDKCQRDRKNLYPYNNGQDRWCGTCISREQRRINTAEMYGKGRRGY